MSFRVKTFLYPWVQSRVALGPCITNFLKHVRPYHLTPVSSHWLDARDPDQEEKNKKLQKKLGNVFEEGKKIEKEKDKLTFHRAVKKYLIKNPKYRRGSVEFIYASMKYMEEYGVHRDLETYKTLLNILPRHVMVSKTVWQAEFMHYPKQQTCIIDLMEQMEDNGVIPDDEFGSILRDIFGDKAHVFRKYQRLMYWLPKFRNANPYPVPYDLPDDSIELAKLALKRMAVDLQNKLSVFQTGELETKPEDTFIVSASSPKQIELINEHDSKKPVFVEGGYNTWLRGKRLTYFILRSDTTDTFKQSQSPVDEEEEEKSWFQWTPFFDEKPPDFIAPVASVHEQADGTILGMCITGSGSLDSLRSWITFLQRTTPKLKETPVVFSLITPEAGLQQYEDPQQKYYDKQPS